MKAMPSRRSDYRLAVVVSRKVHKSAVKRNRIRRRLYETVRVLRKESGINWQNDIVITVFDESVADMPHGELQQNLVKLLQKSGVI